MNEYYICAEMYEKVKTKRKNENKYRKYDGIEALKEWIKFTHIIFL